MATATSKLQIIIDVIGDDAKRSIGGVQDVLLKLGAAVGTVTAAAVAAKKAWDFTKEGAQLDLVAGQFENVATAAGYLPDVLLTDMRQATGGMVSDAELIRSALDIIQLGLADSQQGVVDLSTVVSTLGLDMQQVILTFANNSEMRLDALGLSVSDVRERVAELNAEGFDGDAFDQAVLEGLQARMALLGDTTETTAGQMAMLETVFTNTMDRIKMGAVDLAAPVISATAAEERLKQAADAGIITREKATELINKATWTSYTFAEALDYVAGVELTAKTNAALMANEAADADRILSGYSNAADEAGTATDDMSDSLTVAGKAFSDISTNVWDVTQALQEQIDFLTAGGGVLLELAQTAKDALDEGNFEGAQDALNAAAEGAIDLDLELGNIDPSEAATRLEELGYGPEEAKKKVEELQSTIFALVSQKYTIEFDVKTNGNIPVTPPGYGGAGTGTGGGGTGGGAGGGGSALTAGLPSAPVSSIYIDNITVLDGTDFLAVLADMQRTSIRDQASFSAGAAYVG